MSQKYNNGDMVQIISTGEVGYIIKARTTLLGNVPNVYKIVIFPTKEVWVEENRLLPIPVSSMKDVLKRAQITYGKANQMIVTAEECCELAMVCNKYARFDNHEEFCDKYRDKVIEELADVCICLEHLRLIFDITKEEEQTWIKAKTDRLTRWLNKSNSFNQTTIDREVNHESEGV